MTAANLSARYLLIMSTRQSKNRDRQDSLNWCTCWFNTDMCIDYYLQEETLKVDIREGG